MQQGSPGRKGGRGRRSFGVDVGFHGSFGFRLFNRKTPENYFIELVVCKLFIVCEIKFRGRGLLYRVRMALLDIGYKKGGVPQKKRYSYEYGLALIMAMPDIFCNGIPPYASGILSIVSRRNI